MQGEKQKNKVLQINNLSLKYSEESAWVLKNCAFVVDSGEVLGVVGSNGSGKSSLAYGIIGIVPELIPGIVSGKISLGLKDIENKPLEEKLEYFAYSFQDVETQILFGAVSDVLGLNEDGTFTHLVESGIEIFDVGHLLNREVDKLSTGEAQKIAILATLRKGPNVIIFDEVASNLDHEGKLRFKVFVEFLSENCISMILLGQRKKTISPYAEQILYLQDGLISEKFEQLGLYSVPILDILEFGEVPPKLEVTELTISRKRSGATPFSLGPLTFSLESGEVVALLGANGSGKTSLLDSLYGLIAPTSGQLTLGGEVFESAKGETWFKHLHMVQQSPIAEFTESSVGEELGWDKLNEKTRDAIKYAFPFLVPEKDPLELSFGQQRILNLINAVSSDKPIILIDELDQGLDERNLAAVLSWISLTQTSRSKTIFFSTHDFELAASISDRCMLLENTGKLKILTKPNADQISRAYARANI